jgi:hypothetical protein
MQKAGHAACCWWWFRSPSSATHHLANTSLSLLLEVLTPPRSERCATIDAVQAGILDHVYSKTEALRLAVDAAVTVLRVDQIIMCVAASLCIVHSVVHTAVPRD